MEYYENTGSAVAKFKWTGPSLAGLNGLSIAQEWLLDGTGVTNRIPFAHSQCFAMIQNTAQGVRLTGSGATLTPLTYSIITQPAHGTLSGTNALSLTANGNILPQINQNSSSTVSFGTPIGLAAITQFAGTGNGEVEFSELVSGAGGIIKDSMGSLQLYGLTPNTFSGGIVVNKGTIYLGAYINGISPTCINPAGTGPVSGTARDFTSPQSYTITGSDSTTQTYTVAITMSDAPAPLTYTFDDAILQGWNNRVWNGSAWIDLAANATTYVGSLLPASSNNGLFVPGNGAVWVSGSTDFHLNTL